MNSSVFSQSESASCHQFVFAGACYHRLNCIMVKKRFHVFITVIIITNNTRLQQHPYNGPLSGTSWVSQYGKGKTVWIYRDSEWQWHPYANLHLAPDRQPRQHPTTRFLQARCPSCRPTNIMKVLKHFIIITNRDINGCKARRADSWSFQVPASSGQHKASATHCCSASETASDQSSFMMCCHSIVSLSLIHISEPTRPY